MNEEILPINFLRFLAALGVLFTHKLAELVNTGYLPHFLTFLTPLAEYGYLGVDLFFLISGFVITLSSQGRTVGQFISARFIRLFPVFWICLSITTLFMLSISDEQVPLLQFLSNLTMMPDLYGGYAVIDGSYWTLKIELQFYMFVAVILLLKPLVSIPLEKIALILSAPLLYMTIYFNPYSISFIDTALLNIFYYLGSDYAQYFLAGILFYGIYKNSKSSYYYIALTACYIVALLQALDNAYSSNNPTIVALHVTLFFGLFLAISLRKVTNTSFSFLGTHYKKLLITLGAITYPLYLLHSKIISILLATFTQHQIPKYLATLLLFLTMILIIYLVNSLDFYIRAIWKRSLIVKNLLDSHNIPWLKKFM